MIIEVIIADLVPLRDRGYFMGIILTIYGIGSAVGPPLGGIIVQTTTWRWVSIGLTSLRGTFNRLRADQTAMTCRYSTSIFLWEALPWSCYTSSSTLNGTAQYQSHKSSVASTTSAICYLSPRPAPSSSPSPGPASCIPGPTTTSWPLSYSGSRASVPLYGSRDPHTSPSLLCPSASSGIGPPRLSTPRRSSTPPQSTGFSSSCRSTSNP